VLQAVADTHAVIWYVYADYRLSTTARTTIDNIASRGNQVGLSSITLAEIVYLCEKRRIAVDTLLRLLIALDQSDAVFTELPLNRNIISTMQSVERAQVPDLPDRIIAATALYCDLPLISRDRKIQLSDITTIW
jgi:PIN domain nuclease of toxin-antitoxin system